MLLNSGGLRWNSVLSMTWLQDKKALWKKKEVLVRWRHKLGVAKLKQGQITWSGLSYYYSHFSAAVIFFFPDFVLYLWKQSKNERNYREEKKNKNK